MAGGVRGDRADGVCHSSRTPGLCHLQGHVQLPPMALKDTLEKLKAQTDAAAAKEAQQNETAAKTQAEEAARQRRRLELRDNIRVVVKQAAPSLGKAHIEEATTSFTYGGHLHLRNMVTLSFSIHGRSDGYA